MKTPAFDPYRHIGTCADCGVRCCPDRVAGPLKDGESYGFGDEEFCCCNSCAGMPAPRPIKTSLLIETQPGKIKVVTKLDPKTLPLFKGGK